MDNTSYRTNSFYLAVFLLAKGADLQDVEKNAFNKSIFIFKNINNLQKFISVFNFGKEGDPILLVDFKKIEAAIKKLKSLIYN